MDANLSSSFDSALSKIEKRCKAVRPIPRHLKETVTASTTIDPYQFLTQPPEQSNAAQGQQQSQSAEGGSAVPSESQAEKQRSEAFVFQNAPALRAWMSKVQSSQETAEAALEMLDLISAKVNVLVHITGAVRQQSDALSSNASSLMVKKAKLEVMHAAVHDILKRFTEVDELSREVLHPMLSPYSTRFATMLDEMADLMSFMTDAQHYKSTKSYANKLSVAQHRAMMCLRDAISTLFTNIGHDIAEEPFNVDEPSITRVAIHLNGLFHNKIEATHAAALRMLESRCGSVDTDIYLQDVLTAYKDCRVRLLTPLLTSFLQRMKNPETAGTIVDPLKFVTLDSVVLLSELVEEESKLFEQVWLREDLTTILTSIIDEVSETVYGQYRASLVSTDDLETLRQMVLYLRATMGSSRHTASSGSQLLAPLVKKMISDAQERIVFRTSVFMRTEIQGTRFTSTPTSLIAVQQPPPEPAVVVDDLTSPSPPREQPMSIPGIPALDRTVYLLELLNSTLTPAAFAVFAEEAVHWTLHHVLKLEQTILNSSEPIPPITPLASRLSNPPQRFWKVHGKLFLVHHLLSLRENLAPFEGELTATDKDLDFSQLMQRKLEIVHVKREAKRDVETELKNACELLISVLDESLAQYLRSVPTTAIPAAAEAQNERSEASADAALPAEQPSPKERMMAAGHEFIRVLDEGMKPFISTPATRAVLLKPVRARLLEIASEGQ
jgi:hypothetical protein